VLIASLHRGPNILIDSSKGEINKFIVVQHSRFSLDLTRRTIAVVKEGSYGQTIGPSAFAKLAVNLNWCCDPGNFVGWTLLGAASHGHDAG